MAIPDRHLTQTKCSEGHLPRRKVVRVRAAKMCAYAPRRRGKGHHVMVTPEEAVQAIYDEKDINLTPALVRKLADFQVLMPPAEPEAGS